MQKVEKEKTRYYLAKIHILFRDNFRTQEKGLKFAIEIHSKICFNGL